MQRKEPANPLTETQSLLKKETTLSPKGERVVSFSPPVPPSTSSAQHAGPKQAKAPQASLAAGTASGFPGGPNYPPDPSSAAYLSVH